MDTERRAENLLGDSKSKGKKKKNAGHCAEIIKSRL